MEHIIDLSFYTRSGTQKTLKIAALQEAIDSDSDAIIKFIFPKEAGQRTYRWPAYQGRVYTYFDKSQDYSLTETLLELNIGQKNVQFKLNGNVIKFYQGTFRFLINEGTLDFDLGEGIIHCGLEKTRVTQWTDIADSNTPIQVEDVSIYRVGDNFQCSFISSNGSTGHNKCCIKEIDRANNQITKWEYILSSGKEAESTIIPPGAYVSNQHVFSHCVRVEGPGDVNIYNGSIIESCGYYFSFINSKKKRRVNHPLNIRISDISFYGQFLDGLAFAGETKNQVSHNGFVNAKLHSCSFLTSYDIAKQGIMWMSSGKLEIEKCYFKRSNHDPDITTFQCTFPLNGKIFIKDSYFNGYNSQFENLRSRLLKSKIPSTSILNPYEYKAYLKFEKHGIEYIRDNCLSVIQTNSSKRIDIENCLFEKFERHLILCQARKLPMNIGRVLVRSSMYDFGHPIYFELGLLGTAFSTSDIMKVISDSSVGKVEFRKCYFLSVDTYCWSARVEELAGFSETINEVQRLALILQKVKFSRVIYHNNCYFEAHRKVNGGHRRVLNDCNFHNITLLNDLENTHDSANENAFFLGRQATTKTYPSFSGKLTLLSGNIHAGFETVNRDSPKLLVTHPQPENINGNLAEWQNTSVVETPRPIMRKRFYLNRRDAANNNLRAKTLHVAATAENRRQTYDNIVD